MNGNVAMGEASDGGRVDSIRESKYHVVGAWGGCVGGVHVAHVQRRERAEAEEGEGIGGGGGMGGEV